MYTSYILNIWIIQAAKKLFKSLCSSVNGISLMIEVPCNNEAEDNKSTTDRYTNQSFTALL